MSKNTGVIDSIERTEDRIKDEAFKEIAKHKVVAALILKVAVSEFKHMSLLEIARCIKNSKENDSIQDDIHALLNGEIEQLQTETGAGGEKETRNDIVFRVELPGTGEMQISLSRTINFEMQGHVQHTKPDLNRRSVYYAASLLRNTVTRGDKNYENMHKVYSIWLCNDKVTIERRKDTEDRYIHKIKMHVSYDDMPDQIIYDRDYDFMEVVLVELPKMKDTLLKEEAALIALLYSKKDAIDRIEEMLPIKLERARKAIGEAMNWEERTKYYVEEAREESRKEGRAEGIFRSLDNLLRNNPDVGIDAGAVMLGFGTKELEEYKKARGLEPVGV